jgi:ribosomal protein L37AE/L43A
LRDKRQSYCRGVQTLLSPLCPPRPVFVQLASEIWRLVQCKRVVCGSAWSLVRAARETEF